MPAVRTAASSVRIRSKKFRCSSSSRFLRPATAVSHTRMARIPMREAMPAATIPRIEGAYVSYISFWL